MEIDLEHVAKLARLGLSEEEKKLFSQQLSAILEYANILRKVDTSGIEPTSHAITMTNIFREDKIFAFPQIKDIIANAPEEEEHMFKVPKIIE